MNFDVLWMNQNMHVLICEVNFQVIELPIKHPELFESLGIAQPKVCFLKTMVLLKLSFFWSSRPCLDTKLFWEFYKKCSGSAKYFGLES